jgi:hypothetical protein
MSRAKRSTPYVAATRKLGYSHRAHARPAHTHTADFGRSSHHADLVVAGQVESDSEPDGTVQVLHGGNDGVSTTDSQFLTADQLGGRTKGNHFGAGLAARS